MNILSTLLDWQSARAPLAREGSIHALARLVTLDTRMAADLSRLGFPEDGYTIPAAIELVRHADASVLPLLAEWRRARAELDAQEMALPSSEARRPIAETKRQLDNRMLRDLDRLGVPVWGVRIEAAIGILEAVGRERGGEN